MKPYTLFLFVIALLMAGCGGNGSVPVGDVTGIIEDIHQNPVRNAHVFVDNGPQTFSNSAGSYRLTGVAGDTVTIKATVTQDTTAYYGENVVQIFDQQTSKSTNITMVPTNMQATFSGNVQDRLGNFVQGAHVFVAAVNGAGQQQVFSSNMQLTDSGGNFTIPDLLGGQNYNVVVSATGFNSDTDTINIPAGQTQSLNFTLRNPTDPLLPPPANLTGVAWTTPSVPTGRTAGQRTALEAVKQMIEPRRKKWRITRDTTNGNFVEVDLQWNPMSDPSLIGFGIYRGSGNVPFTSLHLVDFYRDPMAILYEDLDPNFMENQTYTYAITAFNTNAPNTANSESQPSNLVVVNTLNDMVVDAVSFNPVTFNWESGSGATSYEVFVFDRMPSLGVGSIWNMTTTSTSLAYAGPALQSGRTYFYVVLGMANGGSSKTLSPIESFVAP